MYSANMNEHYTHMLVPGVQSPEVKEFTEVKEVKEPLPCNAAVMREACGKCCAMEKREGHSAWKC